MWAFRIFYEPLECRRRVAEIERHVVVNVKLLVGQKCGLEQVYGIDLDLMIANQ